MRIFILLILVITNPLTANAIDRSLIPNTLPRLLPLATEEAVQKSNVESRIDYFSMCPTSLKVEEAKVCIKKKWPPKYVRKFKAYESPDKKSKIVATGRIILNPIKMKISILVKNVGEDVEKEWTSDSTGTSHEYGHFMEYTVLDFKGNWVLFPARPFSRPVWVDYVHVFGFKKIKPMAAVKKGQVYLSNTRITARSEKSGKLAEIPKGSYVIEKIDNENKTVTLRKELESDYSCGDPVPVNRILPESFKANFSDLYDDDGHIVLSVKYTRGC